MKDLVEQLRTVHLTLLAVALILIASTRFERRHALERAANDAEALRQLNLRQDETLTALNTEVKQQVDKFREIESHQVGRNPAAVLAPQPGWYHAELVRADNSKLVVNFLVAYPHALLADPALQNPPRGERVPRTLHEFVDYWDQMRTGTLGYYPIILTPSNDSGGCQNLQPGAGEGQTYRGTVTFDREKISNALQITPVLSLGYEKCQFVPYIKTPLDINLLHVFGHVTPQAQQWSLGPAKEEFRDLLKYSSHLEDTPINDVALALRERADEDPEQIELFQAKFPASTVELYGIIILLIVQFYLLAHLWELRDLASRTTDSEFPTGYIGLYPFRTVQWFVGCSLVVVPMLPATIGVTSSSGWTRAWNVVVALIAMGIGIVSVVVLAEVRTTLSRLRNISSKDKETSDGQ